MRVGDLVRILNCEAKPELVGKNTKIYDVQIQDFEKYRTHAIWVKMAYSDWVGEVYGFNDEEIEVIPRVVAKA